MRDFWEKLEDLVGHIPSGNPTRAMTFLLAPILGFLFFIFLILGNWKNIVKWVQRSTEYNQIEVIGPEDFEEQLIIYWSMEYTRPIPIYKNGQVLFTEFFEKGDNLFHIVFEDSVIAEVIHHKLDGEDGHKYAFSIKERMECLVIDLKIKGKSDSLKWLKQPICNE